MTINPDKDLVDSVREILRKFFRKAPLMLYVAQKATGTSKNKKVFKNTHFYCCLEGSVVFKKFCFYLNKIFKSNSFSESIMESWVKVDKKIDSPTILKVLGLALANVKDWEKKERKENEQID